jgi:hypothetical protein
MQSILIINEQEYIFDVPLDQMIEKLTRKIVGDQMIYVTKSGNQTIEAFKEMSEEEKKNLIPLTIGGYVVKQAPNLTIDAVPAIPETEPEPVKEIKNSK